MLVLQGSIFITSIVIGLLLLTSPVSSIADVGFCDYSNINEPIGVDLGYQYMLGSQNSSVHRQANRYMIAVPRPTPTRPPYSLH
jgi:hypothetical protein